jgi:hypothetical protein
MQLAQPRNRLVLSSLSSRVQGKAQIAKHDAIPATEAYLRCGCHPDVVERLWDQINASLPTDCRYLVFGIPGLVHPSGLILAVGMGTSYGTRILPSLSKEAAEAGAKTLNVGNGTGGMDIRQTYGGDWIFGTWRPQELAWSQSVYAAASDAEHLLLNPSTSIPAANHNYAAIAEQERRSHQEALEDLSSSGDLDATFALFEVLMNSAFKQHSRALLDRADSILSRAVAGGHAKAVAVAVAWPRLRAEAERKFPGSSEA